MQQCQHVIAPANTGTRHTQVPGTHRHPAPHLHVPVGIILQRQQPFRLLLPRRRQRVHLFVPDIRQVQNGAFEFRECLCMRVRVCVCARAGIQSSRHVQPLHALKNKCVGATGPDAEVTGVGGCPRLPSWNVSECSASSQMHTLVIGAGMS